MARTINANGLALIKEHEGCKLEAYQDTDGIWTIGYGHTQGVKPGDICSMAQADMYLDADLQNAEDAVSELVKVHLTDNQFAALVSFTFNVGVGQFTASTMLKKLNESLYYLVPDYLKSWVWSGGRVVPGLVSRRKAEIQLWRTP